MKIAISVESTVDLSKELLKQYGQNNGKFNIGICQLVAHPALDKATEGFIKAVEDGLGKDNVKFDKQEAAGDPAICSTIANSFVSKRVDLIMANATPAVQAAYNSTSSVKTSFKFTLPLHIHQVVLKNHSVN